MIRFQIRPHEVRGDTEMVEILRDGEFVGALYPTGDGVKFVSAYEGTARTDSARAVVGTRLAGPVLREIHIEIGAGRLT